MDGCARYVNSSRARWDVCDSASCFYHRLRKHIDSFNPKGLATIRRKSAHCLTWLSNQDRHRDHQSSSTTTQASTSDIGKAGYVQFAARRGINIWRTYIKERIPFRTRDMSKNQNKPHDSIPTRATPHIKASDSHIHSIHINTAQP